VLNADDPGLTRFAPYFRATRVYFSRKGTVPLGVYLEGEAIVSNLSGRREEVCRVGDLQLRGVHNIENVMAATAIASLAGCPLTHIAAALLAFQGMEHVMEWVRDLRGVTYINDSKGTNVDATIKALESLQGPVILIAGGREKGGDYPGLTDAVRGRVKRAILIGEARARLAKILDGVCPVSEAMSLADAVSQAANGAVPGDTVLLSPLCASFDMFIDYKDRGRQFKERVHELA